MRMAEHTLLCLGLLHSECLSACVCCLLATFPETVCSDGAATEFLREVSTAAAAYCLFSIYDCMCAAPSSCILLSRT